MPTSLKTKELPIIWGEQYLKENEEVSYAVGPTRIALKNTGSEIWVNSINNETLKEDFASEEKWSRWSLKNNLKVNLIPALPDRPVVVKPEFPFSLIKGASAKIYVRIPIWVKISIGADKEGNIVEIPSVTLSNTWFGDFISGQLCYWLSSSARREPEIDSKKSHLVICPINIVNDSSKELLVEKLRLQVSLLRIFKSKDFFWSSETRVSYAGGHNVSQVDSLTSAPAEAKDAQLISLPREGRRTRGIGRTFGEIFDLSGTGFF